MVPVQPSDPATMPAFCFARTGSYELEVAGRKVVGSAQRRQGAAFLQHGSIMLDSDAGRLRRVIAADADPMRGMTTLAAVLGRRPAFAETVDAVAAGFAEAHGVAVVPGGVDAAEEARSAALARDKYATLEWTHGGVDLVADLARRTA
jgi:lipoate-protein ligase A